MIGIDHRHQGSGHGHTLLRESAGFIRNMAQRETGRLDPDRSISMRLDLQNSKTT